MSSYEYNDMFLKCQKTAPYHVFTFDIKSSKKMSDTTRKIARIKLLKFITLMYNKIYRKELEENRKILFKNKDYVFLGEYTCDFGMKQEPFLLGDVCGFTIYRDSIKKEELMEIYNECIKEVGIDFEFHLADGYYETDDWTEGKTKYFRGYCIDLLSNLHKPYNRRLRKKLEKTK